MLVAVTIREELARTVLVEAPDEATAQNYVYEVPYMNGKIVLTADDFAGQEESSMPASVLGYEADAEPDYIVPKDWGKK